MGDACKVLAQVKAAEIWLPEAQATQRPPFTEERLANFTTSGAKDESGVEVSVFSKLGESMRDHEPVQGVVELFRHPLGAHTNLPTPRA